MYSLPHTTTSTKGFLKVTLAKNEMTGFRNEIKEKAVFAIVIACNSNDLIM